MAGRRMWAKLHRHNTEAMAPVPAPCSPVRARGMRVGLVLVVVAALCMAWMPASAQSEPVEITDSISRELSLFNNPYSSGVPVWDVISRELSLFNDPLSGGVPISDVISREYSLFNDPLSGGVPLNDVISRELSLYNDPLSGGVPILDVISREISVNNDPAGALDTENVVSREISLWNRPEDAEPPDTLITSGPAEGGRACPGTIIFGFTGTDNTSNVWDLQYRWRLDGGEWSEPTSSVSAELPGLLAGQHVFEVAAIDFDGNADPTPATRTFSIDLAPPVITGVQVNPGSTTATVTWNTSEPATAQVFYGTTEALGQQTGFQPNLRTSRSLTLTLLEPETRYYYKVVSEDACGHEAESAISSFVTLSLIQPPVIADIPDAAATEGTSYTGPTPVLVQGDEPVQWQLESGPAGMTINPATGVVSWSAVIGSDVPYVVTIRATNDGGTDSESWNLTVEPAYTASVATELDVAPRGTPVLLYGSAEYVDDGSPAGNVPVAIVLQLKGTKRILEATTFVDGSFQAVFQPLPSEAGHYQVGARHPGAATDPVQDEFILVGIGADPPAVVHTLIPNVEIAGEILLTNLGDTPLSGIQAAALNPPSNVAVTAHTGSALAPIESMSLAYTLRATSSAWSGTITIRVTSAEGALTDIPVNVQVKPPSPVLTPTPVRLESGMVRGQQSFVQFEVTNTGGAPAFDVAVDVPAAPWLALTSPSLIDRIDPGESAFVVLSLTPAEDLPLGPYSGSIGVGVGTSYSISVPFEFVSISDAVGDLRILAEDEFTYYGPGNPLIAGAQVALTDPVTGLVVASGETGADGTLLLTDVVEAPYVLTVAAEKHQTYQSPVLVVAGETTEVRAFLPRQVVSYSFIVSPVAVDDRYDIRLEAVFETNVPAPVVTIFPAMVDLRNLAEPKQVDFTITNHGLIAAQDLRLSWASANGIHIQPLVNNFGDLGAQQSVRVPVVFSPDSSAGDGSGGGEDGGCATAALQAVWDLICGTKRSYGAGVELQQGSSGGCGGIGGISWPPGGGGGIAHPVAAVQVANCDPCDLERLKVLLGCVIDFIPIQPCISAVLGAKDCWDCAWDSTADRFTCSIDCVSAMLDAAECGGRSVPYVGHILTTINCLYDLYHACDDLPGGGAESLALQSIGLEGSTTSTVEYLRMHADRLQALADAYIELFGDPKWLEGLPHEADLLDVWMQVVRESQDPSSESGSYIGETEKNLLLGVELPAHLTPADTQAYIDRWNRTLDYWSAGIFEEADLPQGSDPDFIALDSLRAKWDAADAAMAANLAEGFDSIYGGAKYAADVVRYEIDGTRPDGQTDPPEEGICARVRLAIDQRATISRTAFNATLELENAGESPLEGIFVDIRIRAADGSDATDLFSISAPALNAITSVDGDGTLTPATAGSAEWTIIPTDDAAPEGETIYSVSGLLSYVVDGALFEIPLFPTNITVLPNPSLHLKYFWEKDVYSDDPFTPQIEPAEPFSLGLIMSNLGAGTADNVRITTSQPEIIENEKGLLVDFKIIGTQVNDQQASPSLNVNLGNVEPGETSVAQWLMTSSLQGKFIEYSASYEHIDGLGDPRLSLIDSVNIHELIHPVRIVDPADDNRPDFLSNDIPDFDVMPETVHSSDGGVFPVDPALNPVLSGPVNAGNLVVQLTAQAPGGFMYLRTDDPGVEQFELVRVERSDGREILLEHNAWTTHRTKRPQGQAAYREHRLHIFDYNSTGSYTLHYAPVVAETLLPGEAKLRPNGDLIEIGTGTGVIVTGVFGDGFYVEAPDRSSGIRVTGRQAAEGDRVVVKGTMSTAINGERVIAATSSDKIGVGFVEPLSLTLKAMYGGDFQYNVLTGAGQRGMNDGVGLNPVGLLVRAVGRVTSAGVLTFDLSEAAEGSRKVRVTVPPGVPEPPVSSIVLVTGLLSCEEVDDELLPVLRVRREEDIVPVTVGPEITDIQVLNVTINGGIIRWSTDVPADSRVRIGLAPGVYDQNLHVTQPVLEHGMPVRGLMPNTVYHFRVESYDAVTGITSISGNSTFKTLDWGSVYEARLQPNGGAVTLPGLIVTAHFGGFFYAQRPDRAGGGLRVVWNGPVSTNRAYELTGSVGTTTTGERVLVASGVVDRGTYEAPPLVMNTRGLGGGPFFFGGAGLGGQPGLMVRLWPPGAVTAGPQWAMEGLDNVGLLVRLAGRVTNVEPEAFYLDDGASFGDETARGVRVLLPEGGTAPTVGSMVSVTGISSMYLGSDGIYRLILIPSEGSVTPAGEEALLPFPLLQWPGPLMAALWL